MRRAPEHQRWRVPGEPDERAEPARAVVHLGQGDGRGRGEQPPLVPLADSKVDAVRTALRMAGALG